MHLDCYKEDPKVRTWGLKFMWCLFPSSEPNFKGVSIAEQFVLDSNAALDTWSGGTGCCVRNLAGKYGFKKLSNLVFFGQLSPTLNGIQQPLPVYTPAAQPQHMLELEFVISISLVFPFFGIIDWFLEFLVFLTISSLFLPSGSLFDTTTDHLIDTNLDFSPWISHPASVFVADKSILSFG